MGTIQKQKLRAATDHQGKLHLALLPSGKLPIGAAGKRFRMRPLHGRRRHHRIEIVAGDEFDLFPDAQFGNQCGFLHHDADLASGFDFERRSPEQNCHPGVGLLLTEQQGDRRGFPGTVLSQESE